MYKFRLPLFLLPVIMFACVLLSGCTEDNISEPRKIPIVVQKYGPFHGSESGLLPDTVTRFMKIYKNPDFCVVPELFISRPDLGQLELVEIDWDAITGLKYSTGFLTCDEYDDYYEDAIKNTTAPEWMNSPLGTKTQIDSSHGPGVFILRKSDRNFSGSREYNTIDSLYREISENIETGSLLDSTIIIKVLPPFRVEPTCSDSIKNGNETGIDCGGDCPECPLPPSCEDGIRNQGETGVDCGGPCANCPPRLPRCKLKVEIHGQKGDPEKNLKKRNIDQVTWKGCSNLNVESYEIIFTVPGTIKSLPDLLPGTQTSFSTSELNQGSNTQTWDVEVIAWGRKPDGKKYKMGSAKETSFTISCE